MAEPDRIFGYPVKTSALHQKNAIAFGDFSYYNIGDRGLVLSKSLLNHLAVMEWLVLWLRRESMENLY